MDAAQRTEASVAERFARIYDVESNVVALDGTVVDDPYPAFAKLRAEAPVHEGKVSDLLGVPMNPSFRPDLPHYSLFSFEACNTALRENEVFSSAYYEDTPISVLVGRSILEMVGQEHRRYRALVQGAFTPSRAQWWIDRWIASLVDECLRGFQERGHAELNAELCARIPIQTITSSFGLTREEALDYRERMGASGAGAVGENAAFGAALLQRVIDARRRQPEDDVISMLVASELDEDGIRHLLTDEEILGFARLIVVAGSGTTWRQLGILLTALLRDPPLLAQIQDDRSLVRKAIEEVMRWEATDPIFRRLVTRDVDLCGTRIAAGSVVELNLGAANRDPERWDEPDRFDPFREQKPHLGFAGGPHICLGMHVARAEMEVALNAILDRLPDVRFDANQPPTRIIGLEHRGPSLLPVVFTPVAR